VWWALLVGTDAPPRPPVAEPAPRAATVCSCCIVARRRADGWSC